MKNSFGLLALLALSPCVCAQLPPTGGSQIQQLPPVPAPQRPPPEIRIEPGTTPAIPGSDRVAIIVKKLQVTGQTVYPEAELIATTGFVAGSSLALSGLRDMAAKIADYYHRNGYFVAQAYLPTQDIKEGTVTIAVIEGEYGKVTLHNGANLSDSLTSDLLSGLGSGDKIAIAPLERRLLLLSDLPGVNVKSTLIPGASVGSSDLIVDVTPGQRVTGSVDTDNAGNRYTGEYRLGATMNINNPTGHGDVVALRALTTADGLNYGRAAYQTQFGKVTAGVAYATLNYRLGREFASLGANGTAQTVSLYGSYPLIRSRSTNLYAQLAFDAKSFEDKLDSTSTVTDKRARVGMASINGDHSDGLGGGGLSSYSLTWTRGDLDIRSPAALAADMATVQSNGHYEKLGFNVRRIQYVTTTLSLYAAINGQFASRNLDVSEKMELGGAYAVRAYPTGEAYGDQGYVLNLEARKLLPKFSALLPGQMQLIGFVDTGMVELNRNTVAAGPNRRTLSAAGMGINWIADNDFVVKAYFAHKLGNAAATSAPDAPYRLWVQAVKYF